MIHQSTEGADSGETSQQPRINPRPVSRGTFRLVSRGTSRRQWLLILLIMAALVIWGIVHAWGALLSKRGELGLLKALYVLLAMALFLSCWAGLLWVRHRRTRH